MLSLDIKYKICQYLVSKGYFPALERLKRASKEWCYLVLSVQWERFSNEDVSTWYLYKGHIITRWPYFEHKEQARKDSIKEFLEYGHYFSKKVLVRESFYKSCEDVLGTKCPNLKSLTIDKWLKRPDDIHKFIKRNSTIIEIDLDFHCRFSYNIIYSKLFSIDHQYLRRIKIRKAKVSLPSLTFFLNRFPTLSEIEVENFALMDVSDILVYNHTRNPKKELKQYPNIIKFEIPTVFTPETKLDTYETDQMALDILSLFPNLPSMAIINNNFRSRNWVNRRYIKLNQVELPNLPLFQLSKLRIDHIHPSILPSLNVNFPNIRDLTLDTHYPHDKDIDYYETMEIISSCFTQLVQLELNLDFICEYKDKNQDLLHDAIFFYQSVNTRKALMYEYRWKVDTEAINFSFENSIQFEWLYLREISINSYRGFTPNVFLALKQFKMLEKLKLKINKLEVIKDANMPNSASQFNWFPNLLELGLKFPDDFECSTDQVIDLISIFPALKVLKTSNYGVRNYPMLLQAKREFPHIDWK